MFVQQNQPVVQTRPRVADMASIQAERVSLVDKDSDEILMLEAVCGGAPCRVDGTDGGVVRFVAERPGELHLHVDNRSRLHAVYFQLKRREHKRTHPATSQAVVNDFNILRPLRGGWIRRDKSTGRVMVVEAVPGEGGRGIAEADRAAAAEAARTRFTLSVCPAVDVADIHCWDAKDGRFWAPKEWWLSASSGRPTDPTDAKMWVSVKVIPSGKVIDAPTRPSSTVRELKDSVRKVLGLGSSLSHSVLCYESNDEMRNERRLSDYGVQHQGRLYMLGAERPQQLAVHVLMSVDSCDKVVSYDLETTVAAVRRLEGLETLTVVQFPWPLRDEWRLWQFASEGCSVYGHTPGSTITFKTKQRNGKTTEFTANRWMKVGDFKLQVEVKTGIPPADFRLMHKPLYMENHRRLGDYGVSSGSTLDIFPYLRGGHVDPDQEQATAVDGKEASEDAAADGPLVARVVPGQLRPPPSLTSVRMDVWSKRAAPTLTFEVSVLPPVYTVKKKALK